MRVLVYVGTGMVIDQVCQQTQGAIDRCEASVLALQG